MSAIVCRLGLVMLVTVFRNIADAEKRVAKFRSGWEANQWSKKLILKSGCLSKLQGGLLCASTAGCVHYLFNSTTKTCSLFSDAEYSSDAEDYMDAVFTKVTCAVDKEPPISVTEGQWQVFVRRLDGSVNFNRSWADYRNGFGNPCGEFWYGLENLYHLTSYTPYKLRVEMTAWTGQEFFAEYSSFSVGPESDDYTLSISGYQINSTAGDSMTNPHNNMKFSTYDRENDLGVGNCALHRTSGWWFNGCLESNPNGLYGQSYTLGHGVVWHTAFPSWDTFKKMLFMIQP